MEGKSSPSLFDCISKEVRTDLWLSNTSDAEKSVRLYVGFPGNVICPPKKIGNEHRRSPHNQIQNEYICVVFFSACIVHVTINR